MGASINAGVRRIDFIVGATGVGKNRLALSVAPRLRAAIANIDSVQAYAEVQIGANKPEPEELEICPHYLFGFVPIGQKATAADYLLAAQNLLKSSGEKHFLFVGGSGFYIQALEKGMYEVPEPPEEVVQQIQAWQTEGGWPLLHKNLCELDPQAGQKIHLNDHYRIERALEMVLTLGESVQQLAGKARSERASPLVDFKVRKVGLWMEKAALAPLILQRAKAMVDKGLVEETQSLLQRAPESRPPLSSIGYLETRQFLRGEITRDQLPTLIAANTMKLVKKQMTWFKRDPDIRWFKAESEFSLAQEYLYKDDSPF